MRRELRLGVAAVVVLALHGSPARAQYAYPPGYGNYGWNGWGGGGAASVPGDTARGLGAFAAGAGAYREQSAVANSLNVDTWARWNQYVYNAAADAERRRQNRVIGDRNDRDRALNERLQRISENPNEGDIYHGDALNAAMLTITNPKVSLGQIDSAHAKVDGNLIRSIPFQSAAMALTASVRELTREYAPDVLKRPEFSAEVTRLKAIGDKFRQEEKDDGAPAPETIKDAQDGIKALQKKVDATLAAGTKERREADNYLKALYGLMRMMETPAINVLLAGVEKRPDVQLFDLISFMTAFNLRFGVAETPEQRMAYQRLYPMLDKVRNDIRAASNNATVAANARASQGAVPPPVEFFSGMEYQHVNPGQRPPLPPPPGPQR